MSIKLGVSGILIRDGRILLGKRKADDESLPGWWCTPGGQVEFGETLNAALRRAFKEETGLDVAFVTNFMSVQERIVGNRTHTVLIFKEVWCDGRPLALDGFSEIGWFTKDEIDHMRRDDCRVTPLTRAAIEDLFDYIIKGVFER